MLPQPCQRARATEARKRAYVKKAYPEAGLNEEQIAAALKRHDELADLPMFPASSADLHDERNPQYAPLV